jgi:hypothetical protein
MDYVTVATLNGPEWPRIRRWYARTSGKASVVSRIERWGQESGECRPRWLAGEGYQR